MLLIQLIRRHQFNNLSFRKLWCLTYLKWRHGYCFVVRVTLMQYFPITKHLSHGILRRLQINVHACIVKDTSICPFCPIPQTMHFKGTGHYCWYLLKISIKTYLVTSNGEPSIVCKVVRDGSLWRNVERSSFPLKYLDLISRPQNQIWRSRNQASESTQLLVIKVFFSFIYIISQLRRPIEFKFSQVCYLRIVLGHTKWEDWSLTITSVFKCWWCWLKQRWRWMHFMHVMTIPSITIFKSYVSLCSIHYNPVAWTMKRGWPL